MVETADVIIIGAGVQGASLAYHLACRGVRPIIVERSTVAAGATGRSSGLVRMHYDLIAEARLAWASYGWFRDWAELVGGDCGFTRTGFLQLTRAEDADALRANVAAQRAIGIPTDVVDAAVIRRLAPEMAIDDDELAAYEPESGYADPAATATGFLQAARKLGATLVQGAEVTAIPVVGGRVVGVETSRGSFSAPIVVNAAGGWAARVAAFVGLEVPVKVWRHDTAYLGLPRIASAPLPVVIDDLNSMYFRPEGNELVLVGLEDESEFGSSPDRDTADAAADFPERVAERICRRIPAMADATFQSAHSGQDGLTPDQRPLLGAAGPDGFYLDCGHSGTGFKTAPAIGLCMSELILDGTARTADISSFGQERFVVGRLLVGEHPYETIWR